MTVLDLGCGTGKLLPYISKIVGNENVHGIDKSDNMLSIARSNYPDIKLTRADAIDVPYEDNSFDLVIICCVLMHRPDCYKDIIKEAIRVCRGTILINDLISKDKEPTQGRLVSNSEKYGSDSAYWAAYNWDEFVSTLSGCKKIDTIRLGLRREKSGLGEGYYTIIKAAVT